MAGTVVHLLVAQLIIKELEKLKKPYRLFDKDFFVAGNICPDGIMMRRGYTREMKLHTHFRDDIPDGYFGENGTLERFHKRMKEFYDKHMEDEKEFPGLYLGYITHMMLDEYFMLDIRPHFFERIACIGLGKWDKETYVYFGQETDYVDFSLIRDYPDLLKESRKSLERVKPYRIKDMITEEELTGSRNWILKHFFYEQHTIGEIKYYDYDEMKDFAVDSAKRIVRRLEKEYQKYLRKC